MGKQIHFRAQHCQKYALYQKMLQIKIVEHYTSYKKVGGRIRLCPPPWGGARGLPRLSSLKYYNVLKQESRFTYGAYVESPTGVELAVQKESRFTYWLNTAKITNYIKKFSNKSCSELNFVQKSQWAHMSISNRIGARGFKRKVDSLTG